MQILLSIALCIYLLSACNNKTGETEVRKEEINHEKDTIINGPIKQYWLVFLQRGTVRNQDSAVAAKIQERHIANIERLAKEGKIVMAGPMGDDTDLRGIFIMNCKDSMEVVNLVKSDTAIITGRLKFEIHPWWTAQGSYIFN